jgi:arginase
VSGWTLLGVPVYTLAAYKGMGDSPSALRKAGLGRALGVATDLGDVSLPRLTKDTQEGKVKNLGHFRDANSKTFSKARSVVAERVVVLGGECSETVGVMAGFTEALRGKAGMLWMDAHGDFNTPDTSPSGYIGGMCLAMACKNISGLDLTSGQPPLGEERLVHVGSRALDPAEVEAFNSSPAKLYTARQVKTRGASEVAAEAARHLDNRSDWIACHLDVDVVDPEIIPAVNYPTPGGLTLDEAATVIRKLGQTQKLKVVEVAAYNPSKDKKRTSAKTINELLKNSLS